MKRSRTVGIPNSRTPPFGFGIRYDGRAAVDRYPVKGPFSCCTIRLRGAVSGFEPAFHLHHGFPYFFLHASMPVLSFPSLVSVPLTSLISFPCVDEMVYL